MVSLLEDLTLLTEGEVQSMAAKPGNENASPCAAGLRVSSTYSMRNTCLVQGAKVELNDLPSKQVEE